MSPGNDPADRSCMARALELARRGLFGTDPNPRVGCVLVRDGEVVGEGWHARAGEAHAEAAALAAAGDAARGADCFVTLEPCNHAGRTGPCTDALIEAGVRRVAAATRDPNLAVAGGGLARLAEAGIRVESGLLADEAEALNPGFFSRARRRRPWVRLKLAASLDGRTALASGESRWITGEAARADVQHWRARASMLLTGSATVLADDPRLNVRLETPRQPMRVILDSSFRTPPGSRLFAAGGPVVVIGAEGAPAPDALAERARIERVPAATGGGLDLPAVARLLAELEGNELHVECGATLAGAWLASGLVDEVVLYLAPAMLGHEGRSLAALPGIGTMADRLDLHWHEARRVGNDLRLVLRTGA
jgi:diaminohydroxyphosphoribosylaminopyrimidine deaminase/5-amino-6-(5-phosphoribosylamino)uracil reductase